MRDIFNDLEKKLTGMTDQVSKKTGEVVEVKRLNNQIRITGKYNSDDYGNIGKMMYQKYKKGEEIDEQVRVVCEQIEKRIQEIKTMEQQIADHKGVIRCNKCGGYAGRGAVYCPKCGAKLQDSPDFED